MSEISGTPFADPASSCAVHDWDEDHVVVTVVEALADWSGVPADDLPPLHHVIDTEALDAILRPPEADRAATHWDGIAGGSDDRPPAGPDGPTGPAGADLVAFDVPELDCSVTVRTDGRVEIAERD